MMNIEFIFLLSLGPIAWLIAEGLSQQSWRIFIGLFAFLWVGHWGIAITSKYMDSEIKGITLAFDEISELDEKGNNLEASKALSIYRENRVRGESASGASRNVIDYTFSINKQNEENL